MTVYVVTVTILDFDFFEFNHWVETFSSLEKALEYDEQARKENKETESKQVYIETVETEVL